MSVSVPYGPRLFSPVAAAFLASTLLTAQGSGPSAPATPSGTPLAAYRAFFRHLEFLETFAATASPSEAADLRSFQQRIIGLTDQEAASVKQAAATHIAAIDAIEKQAAAVIQAARSQFPKGQLPSKSALPPVPPQLAQFQKQRDDATLAHIQAMQATLSSGSAKKLDDYVRVQFATKAPITPSGAPPPRPPSPQAKGAN
jgi:hypothetical protein